MEMKENDLKNLKCQEVANDLCLNIIKTKEFVWIPVQQRTLLWTQGAPLQMSTFNEPSVLCGSRGKELARS